MAVLMLGAYFILGPNSGMSPEAFITYLLSLSMILDPIKNLSSAFYSLPKGKASVKRLKEILFADEIILDNPHPIRIKEFKDAIEFKDVSFKYQENKVLDKINFKLEKGTSLALVGPSGGGKSTIIDLISRFYDCQEGEISIDGRNIKDYLLADIRSLIAVVSQDTVLFNASIAYNIGLGKKGASLEEIQAAAKAAYAHDFIMQTEFGYDTPVGDGGTRLSGGQRQRLSIARALLKDAPILILDEASSALDTESEQYVQLSIAALEKKKTIITIAHRLSTIQGCDEIFVIEQGKITERGRHQSLLANQGLYAKLCNLQDLKA